MNSGNEKGAFGLSDRTDATHVSRSGDAPGSALTSTPLTTENTAVVAPIVRASVQITATAKPGRRAWLRTAMRRSFRTTEIMFPLAFTGRYLGAPTRLDAGS